MATERLVMQGNAGPRECDLGNILILAGGLSPEREVSLRSGARLQAALRDAGVEAGILDVDTSLIPAIAGYPPDVVFPVIHGIGGEDGSLQEILALLGIPHVGAPASASRLAFDKPVAKTIARKAGLATPASVTLTKEIFHDLGAAAIMRRIVATLSLPLFVKPSRGGSALGATEVRTADELPGAMIACFAYGDTALIEECITGTEVAVGVIDLGAGPCALPPVEIAPETDRYDYAARYTAGQTEFHIPARLADHELTAACAVAVSMHQLLGLRDLSRTDLIISQGQAFFLEVNVSPGLTVTSTFPMALESAGRDLGATCRDLLLLAAARGN
jgi:D-alanine-D-alanine ligase